MIRGGYWGGAWGLSWAGAWGEAWLLLNQPYQELSLKGQVFVRSYLTRIHSVEVAERIVSVAALNNISVIDAETVVLAREKRANVEARATLLPTRKEAVECRVDQVSRQSAVDRVSFKRSAIATAVSPVVEVARCEQRCDLISLVNTQITPVYRGQKGA